MAPVSYYFGVDLYKILVIHRLCVHHMGAYSEGRSYTVTSMTKCNKYQHLLKECILCATLFDFHLGTSFVGDERICFHINYM